MAVHIAINTEEAVQKLRKAFSNLTDAQFNRATAVALNETMEQARTKVKRGITDRYNVYSSFINNRVLHIERAKAGQLWVSLKVSNAPFQLRQTKGVRTTTMDVGRAISYRTLKSGRTKIVKGGKIKGGGVRVEVVKGKSGFIRGAFMLDGKFGPAVVARAWKNGNSSYEGGSFMFRNKRIQKRGPDVPLGGILTVSPFIGATERTLQRTIASTMQDKLEERLVATISRLFDAKG